jgi:hypothetical protein
MRKRNLWITVLAVVGVTAAPTFAADCVRVRTETLQKVVQGPPAVPFTAFKGTVQWQVAGQTVDCDVVMQIDPWRSTMLPDGRMFTFGRADMDFGPLGTMRVWESSKLTPTDQPGVWSYLGDQKSAGGTGAFKNVYATFRLRGLIYLTGDPADPETTMVTEFGVVRGKVCGLEQ